MRADQQRQDDYSRAYRAWQVQLQDLHRVLLEGQSMVPPKLKGLLNREARAKERYDTARRALLGIERGENDPFADVR